MTELQDLMRETVAEQPYDDLDLHDVMVAGRRRARTQRLGRAGVASAVVAVGLVAAVAAPRASSGDAGPAGAPDGTGTGGTSTTAPPSPAGPTLHLSDAVQAVEGRDFRVLATHTNQNLDGDNGQYFDGVTDDGMILFRDGPRFDQLYPRFALMDPATGAKTWLPRLNIGQADTMPVELGAHRLVLVSQGGVNRSGALIGHVFDRDTWQWSTVTWPSLPEVAGPTGVLGPDGRLYVPVLATQGKVPEGDWPLGRNKEADDSGAAGDTYDLWSVSLDDPSDVRDENMSVGSIAFTSTSMVWSDRTNGSGGLIHVRNMTTGDETTFDPQAGARCNLLSVSAAADRVVLDEFCGESSAGVRDDRIQILTTNGDQIVTIQDSGIGGGTFTVDGSDDVVTIFATDRSPALGTYAYDLSTDRFLRISHGMSMFSMGGPTPAGELMWSTAVNDNHGATQWLGELTP